MLPRHGSPRASLALSLLLLPLLLAAAPFPRPAREGAHLFASSFATFSTNQVSCGFSTRGEICASVSGTVGGGYWPKGTFNEYVFNSGLQVAGVIQGAKNASNPWGGDTTGGFFFDPKGSQRHGKEVTRIFDGRDPVDVASWPELSHVPSGDSAETLYDPLLRGRINASDGDLHFITWEGDPTLNAGRPHPLGVLAEYRVMGWNYPAGNDDIMYAVITLYNITSTNPADYAQHRPAMRALLLQKATDFQSANNATFAITLPTGGYTISPLYYGIGADFDVGTGTNFGSVNLPFALGYGYQSNFFTAPGWVFDAGKFGAPFFSGVGFWGLKFLNSAAGHPAIQVYTGHTGGATFSDARDTPQLFRYLSGALNPGASGGVDGFCTGSYILLRDHICFIRHTTGADTRMTQSSTGVTLAPGQSTSFAFAYIFAAPVSLPGFTPASGTQIDPGEPLWTAHPDSMLAHPGATGQPGLNRVDSITGFLAYTGQTAHNGDGSEYKPTIRDFKTVPRSLLGKAQLAQAFFDQHFMAPQPPDAPDFFLIPGDRQVTVLWKPSATETSGDPYYIGVWTPTVVAPGGATAPNALYDPNYRWHDVEGYRIYRGRTSDPKSLRLLAQFDYTGTTFVDYGGVVTLADDFQCAPELGVTVSCTGMTAVTPGVASTTHLDYDIGGNLVQSRYGDRTLLATGRVLAVRADTAVIGGASGYPALSNTTVPFLFVDKSGACTGCGVTDHLAYYYSVTAFDVNSVLSGPSSLESSRTLKSVVVGGSAPNYATTGGVTVSGPYGRGTLLTDNTPATIDPTTGKFNKKAPPSNAASVALGGAVAQVLRTGTATVSLDSVIFVSTADGGSTVTTQWYSANGTVFSIPVTINTAGHFINGVLNSANFPALLTDPTLAATYGGGQGFFLPGTFSVQAPPGYTTGTKGRGCINGGTSSTPFATPVARQCFYNGPRWFIGDNETKNNPNSDNPNLFEGVGAATTNSNAGELAGVTRIWHPLEYANTASTWRRMSGGLSGFISAADYRVYWGTAGKIDSVIDLTHNTVVPFRTTLQASWGVLNSSTVPTTINDRAGVGSFLAITCVAPFKSDPVIQGGASCAGGSAIPLSNTVVPGPVVICSSASFGCTKTAPIAAGQGFVFYIKGEVFVFELAAGLPAAGTAWTMRDYTGAIVGGNGNAGNWGAYAYHPDSLRPFTAPGLAYQFNITASSQVTAATPAALANVHTVPDPYYMIGDYDASVTEKRIVFMNLPVNATVRIYTSSGRLARVLHNTSGPIGATVDWDLKTGEGKWVASGVYFYTVEADGLSRTFRLTIVNYTGKS